MKYKSIKKQPKYDVNPFVEKAIDEIKVIKKTQIMRATNRDEIQMIVSSDGVVEGHSAFMRFIEVDEDKFAKVYLSQFESFWELSKPAIRVFGYIINLVKPNQDVFFMRMDKALEYTKYTHANSVISGLTDLIEHGIVARGRYENEYYINPLVLFNGNRVTYAKTYIKKKKERENQINLFLENE
jgi:hypothetical protein